MITSLKKGLKEMIPYLILIMVLIFIRLFIVTPVRVDGTSMENTLQENDILILNKFDYTYERFDVVVFNYHNQKLIKRVIGLPGEKVEFKNNKLYIDGKYIKEDFLGSKSSDFSIEDLGYSVIPEDEYLLIGDNREASYDSRYFGTVNKKYIKGTVNFRLFPFNKIGKFN